MKTLCENVANLIANNVNHNDLHPKNIMIVQDGETYHPVIIDFGETVINNSNSPKFPRLVELIISLNDLWSLRERDNRRIKFKLEKNDTIDVIQSKIFGLITIYAPHLLTPQLAPSSLGNTLRRSPSTPISNKKPRNLFGFLLEN